MLSYLSQAAVPSLSFTLAAAHHARLPRSHRAAVAVLLLFVTEVWQVYGLIFLLQSASAGFMPTFQATILDVLPDEQEYTRAPMLPPMLACSLPPSRYDHSPDVVGSSAGGPAARGLPAGAAPGGSEYWECAQVGDQSAAGRGIERLRMRGPVAGPLSTCLPATAYAA